MINFSHKKKIVVGGFTLIEALVAVLFLMFTIIYPMRVAQDGLQAAYYSQNQIQAFNYIQEAIEFVRWERDQAAFAPGGDWTGLDPNGVCFLSGCSIQSNNSGELYGIATNVACPNISTNVDPRCQISDPVDASKKSIFRRQISITDKSTSQATVNVTVCWNDLAAKNQCISVTEYLKNWKQ
jgi:type II secretory pathway pseudopilin PulG